jgi:hypothetical protein
MRKVDLNIVPKPNTSEKPCYIADEAPVASANKADVEYRCGECQTVLTELPYRLSLSMVLAELEELKHINKKINIVKCPDCDSFNKFPSQGENMVEEDSDEKYSSPDFQSNLESLLDQTSRLKNKDNYGQDGHFIDPDTHLLNQWSDIYQLTHEELLRFPQYLSDAVFRTEKPRITYDHFVYWGWTAALAAEHPIFEKEPFSEIVDEYLSLIHFMLFKLRHFYTMLFYTREGMTTNIDGKDISWEEAWRVVKWGNPSLEHLSVLPDRYAATTGFATLEGLINAHCDDISNHDGTLVSEVESPWHPHESYLKGETNYHNKLQIWRHNTTYSETKDALSSINDLTRYDPEILYDNIAGAKQKIDEELETTNHFLRVVADQRNVNLHGQLSTRVIGNLITTLSSLIIYDVIPSENFEEHRDEVLNIIQSQEAEDPADVMSAPAFMPVDRVRHLLDMDIITPNHPQYPERFRTFKSEDDDN